MPAGRIYPSASAFRQGLEEWLKTISRQEETDFQQLCRRVAFDRFLARLVSEPAGDWILKGGYAMELRFVNARSTRDLDFTLRAGNTESALDHLQRSGARDIGDFFSFRVGEAMMDLDAAPYGGARFPLQARLDGDLREVPCRCRHRRRDHRTRRSDGYKRLARLRRNRSAVDQHDCP